MIAILVALAATAIGVLAVRGSKSAQALAAKKVTIITYLGSDPTTTILFLDGSRFIVIGGSFGLIPAIKLAEMTSRLTDQSQVISLIGIDPAVNAKTLQPSMRVATRASQLLRFGPLWNKLIGRAIMRMMFKSLPKDQLTKDCDHYLLDQHVRAMRSYNLSAFIDMIGVILKGVNQVTVDPTRLRVGALLSKEDGLLDTLSTQQEWSKLFPNSINHSVADGRHMTFVEHPSAWCEALEQLLSELNA